MPTTAKKASASATTRKPAPQRKATFTLETIKGETIYRPVNKRAKKWAKHVGKRTRVTREDIRTIKSSGKVRVYIYTADKSLKIVR